VKGLPIPWAELYAGTSPRRISVPTYPFAKDTYWLAPEARPIAVVSGRVLHALLHENTSDLREQRYSSRFTGDEFFLADHVVLGERMLPGVVYLEIARAAIEHGAGRELQPETGQAYPVAPPMELKNVVWAQPLTVSGEPRGRVRDLQRARAQRGAHSRRR
jgi:polyketide synthase PksN